jgi:hypothetical protein
MIYKLIINYVNYKIIYEYSVMDSGMTMTFYFFQNLLGEI